MRKFKRCIISVAVFFSLILMVSANSGPIYWQGYPASEVMAIEENTPISVKSEKLVFDFSDDDDSGYTITGKVTASYEMVNHSEEQKTVQMAFPFVGKLKDFSPGDMKITADGIVLPYEVYIGNVAEKHRSSTGGGEASFDFANIVSAISNETYTGSSFQENEKGRLYTIEVEPDAGQEIYFTVDFNFDREVTKVFTSGFNYHQLVGEEARIGSRCNEQKMLEIYVLGEDISLTTNAYTDGELKKKTDMFNCRITSGETELRTYLMNYIKKNSNLKKTDAISDTQLYNMYAEALDKCFTLNYGYGNDDEFMAQENIDRIFTLVYTVEFPPGGEKTVSVSYKTSGTMDMRETKKPLYTFDYILNPAKKWRDFKDLNIEIIPSRKAPYVVKSSVQLLKGDNGVYTAALEGLPETDLSFTLYENEKITLKDKVEGNLRRKFGYIYPLVMAAVAFILVVVAIELVRVRKKR